MAREYSISTATPKGTPIMIEPSNVSHLLSVVDVFCDNLPADLPTEVVEETQLVGIVLLAFLTEYGFL